MSEASRFCLSRRLRFGLFLLEIGKWGKLLIYFYYFYMIFITKDFLFLSRLGIYCRDLTRFLRHYLSRTYLSMYIVQKIRKHLNCSFKDDTYSCLCSLHEFFNSKNRARPLFKKLVGNHHVLTSSKKRTHYVFAL